MEIKTYTAEELKAMSAEDLEKIKSDYATAKESAETVLADIEKVIVDKGKELVAETKEAEQTFVQKYGTKITEGVKIALLAVIIGKLFGVI